MPTALGSRTRAISSSEMSNRSVAPSRASDAAPRIEIERSVPLLWRYKYTAFSFKSPEWVLDRLERQALAFRPPGER